MLLVHLLRIQVIDPMLNDLKHLLHDFQPISLSDQRFDQSHEYFEGQSNQQAQVLQWLQHFGGNQIQRWSEKGLGARGPFRVLSVGCGSGILDLPLIERLAEQIESSGSNSSMHYTGIDPNPVACERFREEYVRLNTNSSELLVLEETVETHQWVEKMDLTHVVHSLYYFADPAVSLRALIKNVAVDGELVIFQAPKAELNLLADCFWQGHGEDPIWFSAELERHLQDTGTMFTKSRVDAEVDVTDCFDLGCLQGRLTFDFIIQSDSESLPAPIFRKVLDYLKAISRRHEGRVLAPHPVDVFVVRQSDDSTTQPDARLACSP